MIKQKEKVELDEAYGLVKIGKRVNPRIPQHSPGQLVHVGSKKEVEKMLKKLKKLGGDGYIMQGVTMKVGDKVKGMGEEVEEARSKEDERELAKAMAAFKKKGGKVKKLPTGKSFKSMFSKGYKPKKLPRQAEEVEIEEAKLGTFKINTGDVVSAKMGKGYSFKGEKKLQPYTFTNRTQAQKHAEKVGGTVINPGRVFYVKMKEEVEIEELYKDYPGKGWVLGTKDEPPKPKPKDIVWRSKVHHWDNDVRSNNTRLIIVDTKKSGKDRFQMWAVSDKSGKVVFHFGAKPTLDDAKAFVGLRKWIQKEEVEIDEKWIEVFGDETYQDSAWFDPADVRTKLLQARAKVKPHDEDEEELAHRLHQQRTNESKKTYNEFVKEQTGSTAVFTFGRFNPPTIGHEKLLKVVENTASSEKGDYFIFMNHSQDVKENPLTYNQKMAFMKMIFPEHRMAFTKSKAEHALELMTQIYEMHGYSKVVMVVGNDRVEEFDQILNKNSGEKGKHGFYRFEDINVISAGEGDPDADGAEGMSAFKMRAAVAEGKYDVFKMGVPTGVSEKDCQNLYDAVAKGMKIQLKEVWGIDEDELDEKGLSPSQRRKMGLRMRILAKKPAFIMKRKRAMKRAATKQKLIQRARKSAIKKVIKKFYPKLRTMKTSDLSYAERGKISDIVRKKSKLIARLAKRMVKDKRKQDIERRKNMNKSKDEK